MIRGLTLEDLPELLLEAGADDYDVATLDTDLRGPLTGGDRIGWRPSTWNALREVLDDPPREEMMPLLWSFNGLPTG